MTSYNDIVALYSIPELHHAHFEALEEIKKLKEENEKLKEELKRSQNADEELWEERGALQVEVAEQKELLEQVLECIKSKVKGTFYEDEILPILYKDDDSDEESDDEEDAAQAAALAAFDNDSDDESNPPCVTCGGCHGRFVDGESYCDDWDCVGNKD